MFTYSLAAGRRDGGVLGPLFLDDFLTKQTAQVDAAMSGSGIGLRCMKETWTD